MSLDFLFRSLILFTYNWSCLRIRISVIFALYLWFSYHPWYSRQYFNLYISFKCFKCHLAFSSIKLSEMKKFSHKITVKLTQICFANYIRCDNGWYTIMIWISMQLRRRFDIEFIGEMNNKSTNYLTLQSLSESIICSWYYPYFGFYAK